MIRSGVVDGCLGVAYRSKSKDLSLGYLHRDILVSRYPWDMLLFI